MKILKLSIQGFTCYREPVVVDFSSLELFAITGPTGSGKSSIIDAIIFALYGKVPRVTNDVSSLISYDAEAMHVLLEFKSGTEKYKVARKVQHKKSTQAILDKWNGEWEECASGVRQVNKNVCDIVGLDYDSFIRCIILPQGEFARFLMDAKSRQDILTHLLNLGILGRMQQKASKNYDAVKKEIEFIDVRLNNEFAGATPEKLQKMVDEYDQLDEELDNLIIKQQKLNELCNEQKELLELWENRAHLQSKHKKYLPRLEQIQALENKMKKARRILPFLPKLEQLNVENDKLKKLLQGQQQNEERMHSLQQELENQKEQVEIKKEQYEKIEEIEERLSEVQKILSVNDQLTLEKKAYERENSEYEKVEERHKETLKNIKATSGEIEKISEEITECSNQLRECEKSVKKWNKYWENQGYIQVLEAAQQNYRDKQKKHVATVKLLKERQKSLQHFMSEYTKCTDNLQAVEQQIKNLGSKEQLREMLLQIEKQEELERNYDLQCGEKEAEVLRLAEEKKQCQAIDKQLAKLQDERGKLQKELQAKKQQLELTTNLYEELVPIHKSLVELRIVMDENHKQCTTLETSLKNNKKKCKKVTSELSKINKSREKLCAELEKDENSYEEIRRNNMSQILREHLHSGEDCPVCMQTVTAVPQEKSTEKNSSAPKELEEKIEALRKKISGDDKKIAESEAAKNFLMQEQEQLSKQLEELKNEKKNKVKELRTHEKKLTKSLQIEDSDTIAENIEKLYNYMKEVDAQKDTLAEQVIEKSGNIREQQAIYDTIKKREDERAQKIKTLEKSLQKLQKQLSDKKLPPKKKIADSIAKIEEKEVELKKLNIQHMQVSLDKNTAEQQLKDTEKAFSELENEIKESHDAWQERRESLRSELKIRGQNVEASLKKGVDKYKEAYEQQQLLLEKLDGFRNEISRKKLEEGKLQSTLEEIENDLAEKKQELIELKEQISVMQQKINRVTAGENPHRLIEVLEQQENEIRYGYQQARENLIRIEHTLQSTVEEGTRLQNEVNECEKQCAALYKEVEEYLHKMQLSSIADINKMKVPEEILDNWENEIQEFYLEFREIEAQINYCEEQLAGRKVNHDEIDTNLQKLEELKEVVNEKNHLRGHLESELKLLRKNLKETTKLSERQEELRVREVITKQLALDLRANKFQTYVLEEALQTLAEDATIQLDILSSGRYSFSVEKREFYVIDHWHMDQVRMVKTLSGGETFIASLSLALALAERIYQLGYNMGSNCTLESLFLDEGFGTLDEDHLDMVIKALNNLQGTGRTIGIISHLGVLNNYLPARLVVEKSRENSTVSLQSN
ncbi:SbcC/MukB-like Walker B domain-containing protein [Candidatus Uabimicrobium amorphum]|uniref:Nuclease SbcCD subunit C n=1 Tax=Uabimicrobium amorphum TaxID=2596890 RepID=A0A5S9IRK3_UABAM|nr:SMC family ATPase [Candidatus Uabimicrobium amorphum]BBM85860.1 Nuclease SbcCD subunit C [Candidatus Uabimicrobium amorphum]